MLNRALSECPLYLRMSSATSVIAPDVFAVPSTLRTRIGAESFLVGIWFDLMYSRSMKTPVAPESTSARMPYFHWFPVLSTSTRR